MAIDRRRFRTLVIVLLSANLIAVAIFLVARPPLDENSWSFLEAQRPRVGATGISITIVHDGLNFALARRAIGGWESASVQFFQMVNFPASLTSHAAFEILQNRPTGSSKLHSDIATAVFAIVAIAQWVGVSYLFSVRRRV